MHEKILNAWLIAGILLSYSIAFSGQALSQAKVDIKAKELIDLKEQYYGITFSSKSREMFVGRSELLEQWNIDEKKLIHTYTSPDGRWNEAEVSPDGEILICANYPTNHRSPTLMIFEAKSHKVIHEETLRYGSGLVREIRFDRTGEFVRITTSGGLEAPFVMDRKGVKQNDLREADFTSVHANHVWDVSGRKGDTQPTGLFCKDDSGETHQLLSSTWPKGYAITTGGEYIGAIGRDDQVHVWSTKDFQEVFHQELGKKPPHIVYDDRDNQFLLLPTIRRRTRLFVVKLP